MQSHIAKLRRMFKSSKVLRGRSFENPTFAEVATRRVADLLMEGWEVVRLGEDGFAQGACGVAALGDLLNEEGQLGRGRLAAEHKGSLPHDWITLK